MAILMALVTFDMETLMTTARISLWQSITAVALTLFTSAALAQAACTLSCPANVTIPTAPGGTEVTFNYSAPVPSNCTSSVVTQTAGLPPGGVNPFSVGQTTNCFGVGSAPTYEATCCFNVTVTATPALPSTPVPMMNTATLLLLVFLIAGSALFLLRRRFLGRRQ